MKIIIKNLFFSYKNGFKIENLNCEIEKFTLLLGPNGCGKTTLLKIILGILKPEKGEIIFDGKNLLKIPYREKVKLISFIPQFYSEIKGFSVFDMIMMGRNPYKKGIIKRESKTDFEKVKEVIEKLSLKDLEKRDFYSLSGGEKQKVIIGRALAQESKILLLDEPTAHLDLKNQFEILKILKEISKEKIILGVFHEPFLSLKFADKLIFMKEGKIEYEGKPIIEKIFEFYGISPLK